MNELFLEQRGRLFCIAYRMLGSRSEAEDMLQEAWLRWDAADIDSIREPAAWLTTVVTRLSLDQLRRGQRQRQSYIGPWLPEPLVSEEADAPEKPLEVADDLSMAFLLLLERLSPEERAAYLLREVFDTSYADVAHMLDKQEAACRKLVSRAKARVQTERSRYSVDTQTHQQVLKKFASAMHTGDLGELMLILHPDVQWFSDGGGQVRAALRVLEGADRILRLCKAIFRRRSPDRETRLAWINGQPGLLNYVEGRLFSTTTIQLEGERVRRIYNVLNPEKLPAEHHMQV